MSVTSFGFLIFALVTTALYFLLPQKWQWAVLLCAGLFFYVVCCGTGIVYVIITASSVYAASYGLDVLSFRQKLYLKDNKESLSGEEKTDYKRGMQQKRKRILVLALVLNFGLLCIFKYSHFAINGLNRGLFLFSFQQVNNGFSLIMPLGMSFYTFQSTGYLIDVYWGNIRAERNFFKTLLFVSFFPQMVQGPISSFEELSCTLYRAHVFSSENLRCGSRRMLWGYFKKLVIADMLAPWVSTLFTDYASCCGISVFLGMFMYSIQIYADFSGYMDIVCGFSEILGIRLRENFERPYFSRSVAEYWRRWHISLGDWFKKYLYYPLAVSLAAKKMGKWGQRHLGKTFGRTIPATFALILVWFTTGLWHGAGWSYIVWGGVNGFFIIATMWLDPVYDKIKQALHIRSEALYWRLFQIIRTFILITFIKVLPEVGTLKEGLKLWKQIFACRVVPGSFGELLPWVTDKLSFLVIVFGTALMLCYDLVSCRCPVRDYLDKKPLLLRYALTFILIAFILVCGCYGMDYDARDFMYFKF